MAKITVEITISTDDVKNTKQGIRACLKESLEKDFIDGNEKITSIKIKNKKTK